MHNTRPLILLTNDDGIHSPGLLAAAEAVAGLGELLIVAPATQQTAMSRALAITAETGAIVETELLVGGRPTLAYAVVGSPVMAVTHALVELADRRPDLCVAGVNYGENVGGGLGVSGTVAAALEAESRGVPGLAVSLEVDVASWRSFTELDWTAARHFTERFARQILTAGLPPEVAVLNLNIPRAATVDTAVRPTVQSRQPYYVHRIARPAARTDPAQLSVETVIDHEQLEPGSDIYALKHDGIVSVTPLTWSMTAQTDWQPIGA